jgi:hypothetical protein
MQPVLKLRSISRSQPTAQSQSVIANLSSPHMSQCAAPCVLPFLLTMLWLALLKLILFHI